MIHPDDTFTVFLDGKPHEDPDDGTRPAMVFKVGSDASWRGHDQKIREAFAVRDRGESTDALIAIIEDRAVEKRNVDDGLSELMSTPAIRDLAVNLPDQASLQEIDRKNSESPSPSVATASAASAAGSRGDA